VAQLVTPYLLYEDAEAAAEFLVRAFGFREVDRQTGGGGGLHLELETDLGGRIYAGQPGGGFRNPGEVGHTSMVYVLVGAVDEHFERARDEGATIVQEPMDLPFGHRLYRCRDPQGHEWDFAEELEPSA
jgi:uncharacterized glyoxalase superfamily protein PhnB